MGNGSQKSAFSTLSFSSSSLISTVPSVLQQSFSPWKEGKRLLQKACPPFPKSPKNHVEQSNLVCFRRVLSRSGRLRVTTQADMKHRARHCSQRKTFRVDAGSQSCSVSSDAMGSKVRAEEHQSPSVRWLNARPETDSDLILSLHMSFELVDCMVGEKEGGEGVKYVVA
ncbi:hypothetical protein Nepgr_009158 [Nepenthes gracilis]|uniref:Uncharacterized protein n=1 Tax=Nepenthes gracilis TaxID=150966 RepID=A0AAD3XJW5_NEPGR|nr:hypothetical protein Nepgr_009158 [Nepenthes gracilis]